ncbi:MAG: hypothetical protein QNK37_29235 [Acidobacteriota bacterium]|nr:hypothetical protein [Acidobacteriota bacterium]
MVFTLLLMVGGIFAADPRMSPSVTNLAWFQSGDQVTSIAPGNTDKSGPVIGVNCMYRNCENDIIELGTSHDGGADDLVDVVIPVSVAGDDSRVSLYLNSTYGSDQTISKVDSASGVNVARLTVFEQLKAGDSMDVTLVAEDARGNRTSRVITVLVNDDTAPVVTCDLTSVRTAGNETDNFSYRLEMRATDNHDTQPQLVAAQIDEVDLLKHFGSDLNGKVIKLIPDHLLAKAIAETLDGEVVIYTPAAGILTVTYRDAAGNETTESNLLANRQATR